jgi:hypothetical protein
MDEHDMSEETQLSEVGMLAHAMSGIARPLKSRILQVVASLARKEEDDDEDAINDDIDDEEGSVARSRVSSLYNICGLLLFYHSALVKTLQNETSNPLLTAVLECLKEATEAYAVSLRVYTAMLDSLAIVTGESEAFLSQTLMGQLIDVRTASPGFGVTIACPSELQSSLSLEFLTTTLLEAALSSCKTLDDAGSLKSSVSMAKKAGVTRTETLEKHISEKESLMVDSLVEEMSAQVLEICGLGSMAAAWKNMLPVEGVTMASQSGLTQEDVELGMKEFYSSL